MGFINKGSQIMAKSKVEQRPHHVAGPTAGRGLGIGKVTREVGWEN